MKYAIEQASKRLDVSEKVKVLALKIAEDVKDIGGNRISLTASIMYVASNLVGEGKSQGGISDSLNVTNPTLRTRYQKVLKNSSLVKEMLNFEKVRERYPNESEIDILKHQLLKKYAPRIGNKKLSETDKQILELLEGWMRVIDIADTINKSVDHCSLRVNRMVRMGLLKRKGKKGSMIYYKRAGGDCLLGEIYPNV